VGLRWVLRDFVQHSSHFEPKNQRLIFAMFTGQGYKELRGEKFACYFSKLLSKLVRILGKGERKLNIFLVLRIKRLSILKCTALLLVLVYNCMSARGMKE